jgi:hypothetical protein
MIDTKTEHQGETSGSMETRHRDTGGILRQGTEENYQLIGVGTKMSIGKTITDMRKDILLTSDQRDIQKVIIFPLEGAGTSHMRGIADTGGDHRRCLERDPRSIVRHHRTIPLQGGIQQDMMMILPGRYPDFVISA